MKPIQFIALLMLVTSVLTSACNKDFLDREPLSNITPEDFLWSQADLESYSLNMYNNNTLPSHYGPGTRGFGMMGVDEHTDNMASQEYSMKYVPGEYRVPQKGGSWDFTNIYKYNYFLKTVLPRLEAGKLKGNTSAINHCIGEIYFFRAWDYFLKVQALGDFPIITDVMSDNMEVLTAASKRAPHSEVVRFILADLDKAIQLLQDNAPDGRKNRLSRSCAYLAKSRVALYEATFLKYFKNTAFVPNGPGWPGAEKAYNANYRYQAGNIDDEINWLLTQAMTSAATVADNFPLVNNTGKLQQSLQDPPNDYYDMFSAYDMSKFSEVLLWRQFDAYGTSIRNNVSQYASAGNFRIGLTRGYVDNFLMENGLPIYDNDSRYKGDDYIADVRKQRDNRLWLFLKEPGQVNVLKESNLVQLGITETYPILTSSSEALAYFTGYTIRKGLNNDALHAFDVGSVVFRATEAYLNYMEACYEKTNTIDGKADLYWKAIRARAKVNTDYNRTIAATKMTEEAKNDWAAYSGGQLISPTLYNIRRERRCEFIGEGFRPMDLKRWRAMDQLITSKYQVEGFKLWGPMQEWYKDASGKLTITYGTPNATVSGPNISKYLRPYQKTGKEFVYNGYGWTMAHYLEPIAYQHFLITAAGGDVSASPIYQNPGWPIGANLPPVGF
ncbi:RagB/SusD family nutrient uptake outer membrane protein [Chitinophaga eiseniae]|uniref:RagB/SusD family nutrient uptake outer membrane protein n=1 Tax=Chitinophaga eiseniae TaxID=634771 RepID=A0A847SLQ0_9BACT|nr:RagB/SusD family nutrient uptake outer membrane protein [Chitinophaga eiseniae]NLR81094.1 RagB/SusD family nutrient uptake outer membrane protein [Chitinophaga eiseniae]